MHIVHEVKAPEHHHALPQIDWADAYQTTINEPFANAREAGEALISAFPNWAAPLLALRQIVVLPFGLKGAEALNEQQAETIGFFPITHETAQELVAGGDDKHLDFRIIITLQDNNSAQSVAYNSGQSVTCTTVISFNNQFGRFYLRLILPFHRAIIKYALRHMASARAST